MTALTKTATKLYKSYLFTIVMKDMRKLADIDYRRQLKKARKFMKGLDFDKQHLLHRVGLTTYRPARTSIGASLFFIAGACAGAVAGMILAPMRGEELRLEIKHRAGELMHNAEVSETQAPARA